jgi:hypothetical protein
MQIFDEEVDRHRFFTATGCRSFKARSSSGPANLTPPSLSAIQCPSLPEADSTLKSALPPGLRKASASYRDNSGEKYVSFAATSQVTGTRALAERRGGGD